MSMPNIPDICPNIDISIEEAVSLLLTSIAMEEISLSKLMDAETDKIKYVLEKQKCKCANLDDVISVNDSVNATIINMSKMQMLLQWKLESVQRIIPKCKPCKSKPPCPHKPSCKPTPPHKHCCTLTGKARGYVSGSCKVFLNGKVAICAHVASCEKSSSNHLTVGVGNLDSTLLMEACPNSICIDYLPDWDTNAIVVKGKGKAQRSYRCDEEDEGSVDFKITVWDNSPYKVGFHILIASYIKGLNFDSGFVSVNDSNNHLKIVK